MTDVKVGDRVEIITMQGEPQMNGKVGVVERIGPFGELYGTWGWLSIYPEDIIKVLTEEAPHDM